MKEKLIELLGLKADASDDAVVAAVQSLQRDAAAESDAKKQDAAIRALVNESHGALSYAAAKQVLADRAIHADKQKGAPKKK